MSLETNVGEYVDMVKAGIVDPLKVIRTALLDASRYMHMQTYAW